MQITCIGHSGFLVELSGHNLIFDFYMDKTGVINPSLFTKKTLVFVSHNHDDHYNKEIFSWGPGDIQYIFDAGCAAPNYENIIKMQEGDSISPCEGVSVCAYGSTDLGVSFLIAAENKVLFHAGDLNDWYWEDDFTPEELQAEEENYLRIIKQLAGQKIDIAFIPQDPRLGRHASRAINHFRNIVVPGRIIPMHFPGNEGEKY